ncbi:MAG: hypothetical protein KDB23_13470 [Planctomycetales bacterium]|nr:hypothetical protein [Planctomycetales bacterium]
MRRYQVASAALLYASAFATNVVQAEMVIRNLGGNVVGGQWQQFADDTYSIQPGLFDLDINLDGQSDLRFEHGFRRPSLYVSQSASQQLNFASQGMSEIQRDLAQLRGLAVQVASTGIHDADGFKIAQSSVIAHLDHINRISQMTFAGQRLLGGDAGLSANASDPNAMRVLQVGPDANEGSYVIAVSTVAERAKISAATSATLALAQDEILTINGVNVQLYANMDEASAIDRINEFTDQTGIIARDNSGSIQLYSREWGSRSEVSIISNQVPDGSTTGFSNTTYTANGTDLSLTIDGAAAVTGNGDTVMFHTGLAKSLVVRVLEDSADATTTNHSAVTVYIADRSPTYLLLPADQQQTLTVAYPNLHSSALVFNSQFGPEVLDRIQVGSTDQAMDALRVIDAAIEEVNTNQANIDLIRTLYSSPTGQAFATSLEVSGETDVAVDLQPLSEGTLVDDNLAFSEGPLDLTTVELSDVGRFLGFRFFDGTERHYGWIRYSLDDDQRIILKQLAYETEAGRGIRVGYVPEPTTAIAAMTGISFALAALRKRSSPLTDQA